MFYNKKIRTYLLISLVFSFLFLACKENKKEDRQVVIQWEGNKAIAISIPAKLLDGISPDSARHSMQVQLENTGADMLGEYSSTNDAVIFQPLIAFTAGLKYEVFLSGKQIAIVSIPQNENADPPEVISIYPSGSDVPENLLKMYIAFSKPMQEGQAMENIVVIKGVNDTVPVFLDLQQELWNKERTILTVWLDPGRIKRGLQPNERSGIPLQQKQHYRLLIKPGWRDAEGQALIFLYGKDLTVISRDSISPSIDRWEIIPPKAGTTELLRIKLHEQLDYFLLLNTISIVDDKGKNIGGIINIKADETEVEFIPTAVWTAGNYTLQVEARLEDLAGNNLNHPFDRDINNKNNTPQKSVYKRSLRIQ